MKRKDAISTIIGECARYGKITKRALEAYTESRVSFVTLKLCKNKGMAKFNKEIELII